MAQVEFGVKEGFINMDIMLTNVRINNFRSIEHMDIQLGKTNVLIGQNNSGKSNFLKAIGLALGGSRGLC